MINTTNTIEKFSFSKLDNFDETCLLCSELDVMHGTFIFNTFMFCQVFNQFNARKLNSEMNAFSDMKDSHMLICISALIILVQILLVEFGGAFVQCTPLSSSIWALSIGLSAISIPVGMLTRLIDVKEDPNSFFNNPNDKNGGNDNSEGLELVTSSSAGKYSLRPSFLSKSQLLFRRSSAKIYAPTSVGAAVADDSQ
jgi:hypothetical protein